MFHDQALLIAKKSPFDRGQTETFTSKPSTSQRGPEANAPAEAGHEGEGRSLPRAWASWESPPARGPWWRTRITPGSSSRWCVASDELKIAPRRLPTNVTLWTGRRDRAGPGPPDARSARLRARRRASAAPAIARWRRAMILFVARGPPRSSAVPPSLSTRRRPLTRVSPEKKKTQIAPGAPSPDAFPPRLPPPLPASLRPVGRGARAHARPAR